MPKATLATIPDRSFRRRPVTVPGGGGATLRSGKGVWLSAAPRAFLRRTETPPPVRLHLQPLQGRPGLLWTSGRSEMRLCFCAGLSPLPETAGFPPLSWEVQGLSPATVEPRVKKPVSAGGGVPARGRRGLSVKPQAEGGAQGHRRQSPDVEKLSEGGAWRARGGARERSNRNEGGS